ncbi:unnamed protein product [Pleuronectes platessa]|uniref:Uncharacterized protein n=1 Tax=Pleuronectes platessa TaxID=8262 RepID=A0A9N7ZAZ1_PLEPL|nr:unnamed protein product [Pleuronectes platessa]
MQMGQTGDRTADLQVGGRPLYPSDTHCCTVIPAPPGCHIHMCGYKKVSRAQSIEKGGDTRRPAITQGELYNAVEGHEPSSRIGICSFVQGGTGGTLPWHNKMTSSRLLVTKPSDTDPMRVT